MKAYRLLAIAGILALVGCKGQEQLKTQVTELDGKLAESQKKVTALESDLKKTNAELAQLKTLVTKLGNVTVDLQNAEESRKRAAVAPKPKTKAAALKKNVRKPSSHAAHSTHTKKPH